MFPPACLAKETDGTTFDGKKVTVVGWGYISQFPYIPHIRANAPYELNITIEENCLSGFTRAPNYFHMCAGRWSYLDGPEPDKYWYYRSTCTVSWYSISIIIKAGTPLRPTNHFATFELLQWNINKFAHSGRQWWTRDLQAKRPAYPCRSYRWTYRWPYLDAIASLGQC